MQTSLTTVRSILTRASGFLTTVCSHSLQPYRGCPFGASLCGVGCYVQHNIYTTQGRAWGSFLEVRTNAAEAYLSAYDRERAWARRSRGRFVIFLSSSTEPFPPQESRHGITRSVLEAMRKRPPDGLIVQTHSHRVVGALELLLPLARRVELRVHVSIESDRDRLPGLPRSASTVDQRFAAASALKVAGLHVVITVAPLLPIAEPERFFARVAECADAVVLDHYIEGDGSPLGTRTARTRLPAAMAAMDPHSTTLPYRDRMATIAQKYLPGRVGINRDGFAGRWTEQEELATEGTQISEKY
ncbi:MAG TPA: radical SAM protein [Isosphaeraceae bacterium]|jgi:DNA repair photolyase|nr:radical SAM protein [Isosphaeraceae bacterium]